MDDRTDKLKSGAESKWTAPPRKPRTQRREEVEEGAVLGKTEQADRPPLVYSTRHTPAGEAQAHAESQFMLARQRAYGAYLDRLPLTYDGGGQVRQQTITKHFTKWVDEHDEEMTKWAVEKFFREVYLWQKDDTSYDWAPHTNLSNWMKVPGSRAIRQEYKWRCLQRMMKSFAEAEAEFHRTGRHPQDVAEDERRKREEQEGWW